MVFHEQVRISEFQFALYLRHQARHHEGFAPLSGSQQYLCVTTVLNYRLGEGVPLSFGQGLEDLVFQLFGNVAGYPGRETLEQVRRPSPLPRIQYAHVPMTVPVMSWRSVQYSQNGFFGESFMDELAHAAGVDPLAFRKANVVDPRFRALLDEVEQLSDWSEPLGDGQGRGVAIVESWGSIVAEVVQVKLTERDLSVEKVSAAIDCGTAVYPDAVRAQVIFGLTAALFGEVNVEDGGVFQSNYDTYLMMQMSQTPEINVSIINSGAQIGGVGEPGLPPAAPALVNAIYAAIGQRLRRLPVIRHDLNVI